jgi:hypothetical protein
MAGVFALQAEWTDELFRKDQVVVDEDYGALVASPEGDGTQQEGQPPPQQQAEPPLQQQ